MNGNVAVWEYCNDYGFWETFGSFKCKEIEKKYEEFHKNPRSFQNSEFNFNAMEQHINANSSGPSNSVETIPIRRITFSASSCIGQGVTWQWNTGLGTREKDFVDYPADVVEYIEKKYQKKQNSVNLAKHFPSLCYTLYFNEYKQINNNTDFFRYIQRSTRDPFPKAIDIPSTSANKPRKENAKKIPKDHILFKFANVVDVQASNTDDCCICMSPLQEESGFAGHAKDKSLNFILELNICKHTFHGECLDAALKNNQSQHGFVCPYCKKIYGVKMGNQPPGTMTDCVIRTKLPGFHCDTIQIVYDIRPGVQRRNQSNPGQSYTAPGFPRTAYLPNNQEGQKILKMLKIAWERRLIFTIGISVTTGRANCVTWNEIHHKTSIRNHGGHGYPDPNYLTNVVAELKALGVTENDIS